MPKRRKVAAVASAITIAGGVALVMGVIPSASAFSENECVVLIETLQAREAKLATNAEFSPEMSRVRIALTLARAHQADIDKARAELDRQNGIIQDLREQRSRGQRTRSGQGETSLAAAELVAQRAASDASNEISENLTACESARKSL